MPRQPRAFLKNMPVHLIQRGNNRQACFFTERDYIVYLDKLREASLANGVAIHSFVLMTNHVHILCTPTNVDSISRMMQGIGRYYVRYVNSTYERSGTLWEGRFRASLVHSERYLLTVSRYIEMNPVRAFLVDHPEEYQWTSYHANGLGTKIKLLTPHPVYLRLGRSDSERLENYRALFESEISDLTMQKIRVAVNKSWALGDDKFKKYIEKQLGRVMPPLPRGGDRKSHRKPDRQP